MADDCNPHPTVSKIALTLDNNVWDFLFLRGIDLAMELPSDEFTISITREVEIETLAIPPKESKEALKAYIDQTIEKCDIRTTSVFGFAHNNPNKPQTMGGFGQGTWQSEAAAKFYKEISPLYLIGKKDTNSLLSGNQADAAVAAKSLSSIALTCESPLKSGPLRYASEHGGKVLYLGDFDASGQTLRDFIKAFHTKTTA